MAKKDFSEGIDSIIGTETYEERIAKMKELENISKPVREEITFVIKPEEEEDFDVKKSFVFSYNQVLKVKSVAFWEQSPIKTIMYEALGSWIKKYERANGTIITPESKKK